jgi:nitrite reductase/ring-hydroxylating ferredoxin subunit
MIEKWVIVGQETEFSDGLRMVLVGSSRFIVARLKGTLFAFDAVCPHASGPMDRAEVDGAIVSCPLHAWRFDLENGGKELHGYRSIAVRDIKVEGGAVYIAAGS